MRLHVELALLVIAQGRLPHRRLQLRFPALQPVQRGGGKREPGVAVVQILQLLHHPREWRVRQLPMLIWLLHPPASHVAMVAREPDLLDPGLRADVVVGEQGRLELEAPLVDGHGVPNVGGGGGGDVPIALAKQRDLELADAVDAVEQAEKMNHHAWAAEGGLEVVHVLDPGFIARGERVAPPGLLILAEGVPGEADHLLVPLRQQANGLHHFGQEPGGVGAAGEAEDVDGVARGEVAHDELISPDHVRLEGAPDGLIHSGGEACLEPLEQPSGVGAAGGGLILGIGANAGWATAVSVTARRCSAGGRERTLVIVKLLRARPVEHLIQLHDVRVGRVPGELVARSVEAEHQASGRRRRRITDIIVHRHDPAMALKIDEEEKEAE